MKHWFDQCFSLKRNVVGTDMRGADVAPVSDSHIHVMFWPFWKISRRAIYCIKSTTILLLNPFSAEH
jgi:hypothetical protein